MTAKSPHGHCDPAACAADSAGSRTVWAQGPLTHGVAAARSTKFVNEEKRMKRNLTTLVWSLGTLATFALPISSFAQVGLDQHAPPDQARIIEFDAPGAGTGSGQGTLAIGINAEGETMGYFLDANSTFHGFVRSSEGRVTAFDAPGAGTGAFQGTGPFGLNSEGAITGLYVDADNVAHGFLRART